MTTLDVYKSWLGIPDGPRPPGHYELLRLVEFEDDPEKIRGELQEAQRARPTNTPPVNIRSGRRSS